MEDIDVAPPAAPPRFIIGDNETAGLGEACRPVQIGLIEIDPITLDVMWEREDLIDPEYPIQEKAFEIHGISNEMVAQEPTMAQYVKHRLNGGLTGDITLIAHNAKFDFPLLLPIGNINRTICTLNEARNWLRGPPNYKLATLAEHYGFRPDTAHQALADCHTTRLLLQLIMKESGQTLEQLATFKARTVHICPWGKHMGTPLVDVPRQYLKWMMTLDLETNLRNSVEKVLSL